MRANRVDISSSVTRVMSQSVWGLVLSAELMHREQAMFVHTGAGSNGKSTAFSVLTAILGGSDKSCTDGSWVHTTYVSILSPETFMQSRRPGDGSGPTPHLLAMNGTRMNLVNELPIGGRWNESLVKAITGKDPIAARHMYSELVKQINVEGLLHFLTNHVPNIDAANFAMMRRLRMIPWSVRFDEQKMDPDLPPKLMAEQTGIVQWLVEGLRMYKADKANGTNPRDLRHAPPAVTNCMQAFLKSIDVVEQFLTDEVQVTNEPTHRLPTADLYRAFQDWAHSCGYRSPPLTRRGVTEKMKSKGFVMGHGRTGDFFEGMQLNNFF